MNNHIIKVAEMFAGVGGFHLGLSRASRDFKVVWADQYEPSRKNQFAFNIYRHNFPETNIVNDDIEKVVKSDIPDINLLVGGFPCQDYSVASSSAKGLFGKKGVLWWDIRDVVKAKFPQFILLENVDRLLASPGVTSKQPGRDFGMILRTLADLGYCVSWKMINAADYGFPQRRRRTFIFAARKDTAYYSELRASTIHGEASVGAYIKGMAPLSSGMKIDSLDTVHKVDLYRYQSLSEFSDKFSYKKGFRRTGMMVAGQVYMANYEAVKKTQTNLGSVIRPNNPDNNLWLRGERLARMKQMKSGFQMTKTSRRGDYTYRYGMGDMRFPDSLELPARTMVTSEHTISRMSHVIQDPGNHEYRLLSPEETEQINTFPAGWTELEGVSNPQRYFTMGNALVVNLVRDIGKEIDKLARQEPHLTKFNPNSAVENVEH